MDLSERVSSALSEAVAAGELGEETSGMPAQFVLVATFYDSDGQLRTALCANDGAHVHETLGLLELGKAAWGEEARAWVLDD